MTKGLVQLEPTAEIHGANLREALFQALMEDPTLNQSKHPGKVWVNLKIERLTAILFHLRRLKSGMEVRILASQLTSMQFLQVQEVLDLMDKKKEVEPEVGPPLVKRDDNEDQKPAKKLKKEISDVSVDSQGFPLCLATPPKPASPLSKGGSPSSSLAKGAASPYQTDRSAEPLPGGSCAEIAKPVGGPTFLRRRLGQKTSATSSTQKKEDLKEALGFVLKKPAGKRKTKESSKKKEKPLPKGAEDLATPAPSTRMKWTKLSVITSHKEPFRSYILGATAPDGKEPPPRLIVEATLKKHPKYKEIVQHIQERLEKEHLTKVEAINLRNECYETW